MKVQFPTRQWNKTSTVGYIDKVNNFIFYSHDTGRTEKLSDRKREEGNWVEENRRN